MRRNAPKLLITSILLAAAFLGTTSAKANKLELTPANFIECNTDGVDCRAHNVAWERFMSEYSFGISPKLLAPSSTLGYSGFYLGIEASIATIPSSGAKVFMPASKNYEDARWRIGTGEYNQEPPAMLFPTIHVRKGLPWSLEVGSSISYLAQSELVALGGEVKWAPFEGYRKGFRGVLPDIAARGTVNRILGESDVDMTILGVDGSIGVPFGIGGMIALEPYAGYQYTWTFIRTEPMMIRTYDANYNVSAFHESEADSYDVSESGLTGPDLGRHKIYFGLNFRYEILSITMDWTWGLPMDWTTKEGFDSNGNMLSDGAEFNDAKVHVDTQFSFAFGAGLQF
ncbi:MAG: hypothetical protein JXR91_10770 [Deltaproteobacteria bacterium]|nr:hypothetical protein [Deltaproteobacteria bacterium]